MGDLLNVANVLVFGFLGFIWKNEGWPNMLIKVALIGMFVGNLLWCMHISGYIVRLPS